MDLDTLITKVARLEADVENLLISQNALRTSFEEMDARERDLHLRAKEALASAYKTLSE